jgi:hypothetical protein
LLIDSVRALTLSMTFSCPPAVHSAGSSTSGTGGLSHHPDDKIDRANNEDRYCDRYDHITQIAMPHLHEAGFMPRPQDILKMNPARRLSAVALDF